MWKQLQEVKYIAIHCSATKPDQDIGVREITRWHMSQGWLDIGYHWVIRRDGTLEEGRKGLVEGAHVKGFNHNSIGICMVGGLDDTGQAEDNFTDEQWIAFQVITKLLQAQYPEAIIQGHRDFPKVSKECPCFDVQKKLGELNVKRNSRDQRS